MNNLNEYSFVSFDILKKYIFQYCRNWEIKANNIMENATNRMKFYKEYNYYIDLIISLNLLNEYIEYKIKEN